MASIEKYNKLQAKVTNIFNKLLTREERTILEEAERCTNVNYDALMLNTLRKEFNFTPEQLKAFFDKAAEFSVDVNLYSMQGAYTPDLAELSEAGINLLAWEKEVGTI